MFDGKTFFGATGMPIEKIARVSTRFADWLPDPLTVAARMVRSLTMGSTGFQGGAVGDGRSPLWGRTLPLSRPSPSWVCQWLLARYSPNALSVSPYLLLSAERMASPLVSFIGAGAVQQRPLASSRLRASSKAAPRSAGGCLTPRNSCSSVPVYCQ